MAIDEVGDTFPGGLLGARVLLLVDVQQTEWDCISQANTFAIDVFIHGCRIALGMDVKIMNRPSSEPRPCVGVDLTSFSLCKFFNFISCRVQECN